MALVCDIKSNPAEEENLPENEVDLEDGEIEDDGEEIVEETTAEPLQADIPLEQPPEIELEKFPEPPIVEKNEKHRDKPERERRRHDEKRREEKGHRHMTEAEKSILHLRKKEKMLREREKWEKDRIRKPAGVEAMDDDFAKNIEKTLATILSKKEKEAAAAAGIVEEAGIEKRGKKRKHHDKDKHRNKRRNTDQLNTEEIDENELLNVRSGSPEGFRTFPDKRSRSPSRSEDSYESEYSTDQSRNEDRESRNKKKNNRRDKRKTKDKNRNRREREKRNELNIPMQDKDGVCVFYMQGKCQNNNCPYSHEANPPMKLELCKFYVMDCCAKGMNCSYMHSEFPCKFYHLSLRCNNEKDCKFAHGPALTDGLKQILFKHIETAPREILGGGFPRLTREETLRYINDTQARLQREHGTAQPEHQEEINKEAAAKGGIPSLFDISVPVPPELNQPGIDELKPPEKKEKPNRKRASRWQDPDPVQTFPLKPFHFSQDQDMRINSNGDIDMRALPNLATLPIIPNIQAPPPMVMGRENLMDVHEPPNFMPPNIAQLTHSPVSQPIQKIQDIDIRGTNLLSSFNSKDVDIRQQAVDARFLPTMDVDIRQIPGVPAGRVSKESETEDEPMLQIDTGEEETETKINEPVQLPNTAAHLFARIQAQQKDESGNSNDSNKSEDRFDVDVADINWYSDDDDDEDDNRLTIKVEEDEKAAKDKEDATEQFDQDNKQDVPPPFKPMDVVSKLGDLSKIDISAEVTKLLTSMSQNRGSVTTPALKTNTQVAQGSTSPQVSRSVRQDPRMSAPQDSPRSLDPRLNCADPRQRPRQSSTEMRSEDKKSDKLSIYEQGGIDMNLKNLKAIEDDSDDFKGARPDIDLRNLGLPFKGMQNYTPAKEIDASINSHLPILWRVFIVEIPRPDYTGLKLSINDAEKTGDPRLRKIFRLSTDEKDSPMSPKASPKASPSVRVDPRLKKVEEKPDTQMNYVQQLNVLQGSVFYQSLTSNQKLMLNQELATRADQSGMNDPVLNAVLSNLNLVSNAIVPGTQNASSAMSILSNVANMNQMLGQPGMNPGGGMVMQPGLLGAAPGIPNVVPPDFSMGFDPRGQGLLGNGPPPGFAPNFGPEGQFQNFGPMGGMGGGGDEFYPQNDNFGNRGNRDFGGGGGNRDNRRRGRNFNNRNNRNNFRNNGNRNNNRTNRNHSPP